MPVPSSIDDLSTTAASNSPAGSETPTEGDNYIRTYGAFIAALRDKLNGTSATGTINDATFSGTMAGAATWAALQTFAAGITVQTASGNVFSNTYAPTLTAGANISGSPTATGDWLYTRVGDQIAVDGEITSTGARTAAANTLSEIGVSLPVASAFTLSTQLAGVTNSNLAGEHSYGVIADTTNDRALVRFASASTSAQSMRVHFKYRVI